MPDPLITLRRVDGDRGAFIPLLLEADESEPMVRGYLEDGELFELLADSGDPAAAEAVGVVLLTPAGLAGLTEPDALEIKNIALRAEHRGRGLGRAAVRAIAAEARSRGAGRLLVGTADSSVGTIAFYRACGFRDAGRLEGFFDAYPEPVIENGVQAHGLILFEMSL